MTAINLAVISLIDSTPRSGPFNGRSSKVTATSLLDCCQRGLEPRAGPRAARIRIEPARHIPNKFRRCRAVPIVRSTHLMVRGIIPKPPSPKIPSFLNSAAQETLREPHRKYYGAFPCGVQCNEGLLYIIELQPVEPTNDQRNQSYHRASESQDQG